MDSQEFRLMLDSPQLRRSTPPPRILRSVSTPATYCVTERLGRVTANTYNARHEKTVETYPDHTPGTSPGDAGYGQIQFAHDPAGRLQWSCGKRGRASFALSTRMPVSAIATRSLFPVLAIDAFIRSRASRVGIPFGVLFDYHFDNLPFVEN